MTDDKIKFDPTSIYAIHTLWKLSEPTKAEALLPTLTRSEALKGVRLSIAEVIPRGFRSKVKIRSGVVESQFREWRVLSWIYDPSF